MQKTCSVNLIHILMKKNMKNLLKNRNKIWIRKICYQSSNKKRIRNKNQKKMKYFIKLFKKKIFQMKKKFKKMKNKISV